MSARTRLRWGHRPTGRHCAQGERPGALPSPAFFVEHARGPLNGSLSSPQLLRRCVGARSGPPRLRTNRHFANLLRPHWPRGSRGIFAARHLSVHLSPSGRERLQRQRRVAGAAPWPAPSPTPCMRALQRQRRVAGAAPGQPEVEHAGPGGVGAAAGGDLLPGTAARRLAAVRSLHAGRGAVPRHLAARGDHRAQSPHRPGGRDVRHGAALCGTVRSWSASAALVGQESRVCSLAGGHPRIQCPRSLISCVLLRAPAPGRCCPAAGRRLPPCPG
jgi:hypothetical protein